MQPALPPPETPEARRTRQFATLHYLSDLGTDLATDAHAQAKQQLAPPEPHKPRPNALIDYAATFAAMFRAVRAAIALEIRLDAPARARPLYRAAAAPPDPRRILLRKVFHDAVAHHPDRAQRKREIDAGIDDHLEADPDSKIPIEELLGLLIDRLGIQLDLSKVPDAVLGIPPRTHARDSP